MTKQIKSMEEVIEERMVKYFQKHCGIDDFGCEGCIEEVNDLAKALKDAGYVHKDSLSKPQDHCCGKKIVLPEKKKYHLGCKDGDCCGKCADNSVFNKAIDLCQQAINQQGCARRLSEEEIKHGILKSSVGFYPKGNRGAMRYTQEFLADELSRIIVNLQDTKLKGGE